MKKKSLYIAGICAALSVGALGCASSAKAGDEENKTAVEDTKAAGETTAAETSESNTVIEKNAPSGPASGTGKKVSSEFICVYGPVSEVTSDSVTIDNQSGISSAGEMVIDLDGGHPFPALQHQDAEPDSKCHRLPALHRTGLPGNGLPPRRTRHRMRPQQYLNHQGRRSLHPTER